MNKHYDDAHFENSNIQIRKGTARRTILRVSAIGLIFLPLHQVSSAVDDVTELRELVLNLSNEVNQLRSEVERLRMERLELRESENIDRRNYAGDTIVDPVEISLKNVPNEMPNKVWDWYGMIKVDAFHDSATTSTQEFPFWTLEGTEGISETDMTAKQSKLGLNFSEPSDVFGGKLTGKLELDFFGNIARPGNVGQNHAYQLRSRHVYLNWSNDQWSWLAGKTSQIYEVVVPETINAGYYRYQGRIGHRRLQANITRKLAIGNEGSLSITGGIEEPVGTTHGGDLDNDGIDDATRSELPEFVSRLRYDFKGFGGHKSQISFAGLYGEEEVFGKRYSSYGTVVGGMMPLTDWLQLKGTYWFGSNLDSAGAGIAQGINTIEEKAIESHGGWAQLKIKPGSHYWFNIGYSQDDPSDKDLNDGQRSLNETTLVNSYLKLAESLTVGLEYFKVSTSYKGGEKATNHRFQTSVMYKF
ncbi:cell division protein ZapB [Puniceicoccaceae bacterium K14]|nr:cell division protein ZapB [Puniceicoccaceae bacterium K14]